MNELVSVILPIYNVEKFLHRCVERLLDQTYTNIEIILVDDGATDSSGAICDEFAARDERVVVIHKQNAGLGLARNSGLEVARGRYVMFVDSDDYIDTDTIRKCIEKRNETGADVIFFGRVDAYDDGGLEPAKIASDKLYFEGEEVVSDLFRGLFTYERGIGSSAWGCMIDLDLLRKNGVAFRSERIVLAEDTFFWIELFPYVSCAAILTDNLYYYYQNRASITRRHNPGHQFRNNTFLKESLKRCEELGLPEVIVDRIYVKYHIHTLSGMKRILRSPMTKKEKNTELKKVFKDPVLAESFKNKEALKKESSRLRFFWAALRARLYFVCYLLLLYKIKR